VRQARARASRPDRRTAKPRECAEELDVHSESQARLGDSASSTPLLLTIPEVADELRVDKRTVYRLLRSGELDLPVIHVGSSPRVRRLDLEQHLARLAADEEEAEGVNPGETGRRDDYCAGATSCGLLIQAGPGSGGGCGSWRTNRSGCAA